MRMLQNFSLLVLRLSVMSNSLWPNGLYIYSLPDSSVHGIFQARILEWVVISYSIDMPYCFKWQDFLLCFLYHFSLVQWHSPV